MSFYSLSTKISYPLDEREVVYISGSPASIHWVKDILVGRMTDHLIGQVY